jgi:MscS family membrane protein
VHGSPRVVLQRFMKGMRDYHELKSYNLKDQELALSCFSQSDDGPSPQELGNLAVQLYESLSRMTVVEPRDLAGESAAQSKKDHTWVIPGEGGTSPGNLRFVRIDSGADGEPANWRFAPTLFDKIPAWYTEWKDEPLRAEHLKKRNEEEENLTLPQLMRLRLLEVLPDSWRQRGFLLEHWQWVGIALLISLGAIFARIVNFILRIFAKRLERSERLKVDKDTLVGFERPFSLFVLAGTMLVCLPALSLDQRTFEVLRLAAALFLSITGVWSAYRLVDVGASILQEKANQSQNRFDDILVPLVRRIAKIFLTFVGVVFVASYLSEDLYGIVAGLSIGSLALGFAAKDSIENLFGTVTVLLDKPYQLGDWVTVGDIDGSVEEVGFRSTKVRTFYDSIITVPNSRFISAHIENWGERRYRRIKTNVGIAYSTPPLKIEAFCEAIRELVRKHPYTRKDYYHIYLNQLSASSLDILVYCFVETPDWSTELREKHRMYLDILRVAEGLGVELAFPTQTLHIAKDGDEGAKHDAIADDAQNAERMGRELADLIVRDGLSEYPNRIPPPVVID